MFEKDYIMRQIQMMVAAFLKIMHLISQKDYYSAKAEIKDAVKLITGFNIDQIKKLEIDDLILIFSLNKEDGYLKAAYTAKILSEEAKIMEEEKDFKQSIKGYNKALEIFKYIEKVNRVPENIEFNIHDEINFLSSKTTNHR